MARKYYTPIDLSKLELQNAVIQNLPSAPSSPVKGQVYYDTVGNILYWYNGSGWVAAQGGAGAVPATTVTTQAVGDAAVVGVATTYAREDHKHGREAFGAVVAEGTFGSASTNGVAATVARSDHAHGNPGLATIAPGSVGPGVSGAVGSGTLAAKTDHTHGFQTAIAALDMGNQKIVNLGTPTAGTDATTKDYVDNLAAGLSWKESCRAATTANITLSAPQTIDGVSVIAGDRVLVKNQSTGAQNGIYLVAAGAWTRATDADAAGELDGAATFIMEGTTLADTGWVCTTNAPITIGSTATVWAQFTGGSAITAGAGLVQNGNAFDVTVDASLVVAADLLSRAALTGDVTAPASSNATTIANSAVTNAKMANMVQNTIKGRVTASTGAPEDLTVANLATIVAGTLARKFATTCAAATSTVVNHAFNTRDVFVSVMRTISPWDQVECDVEATDANNVTVRFATAPAAGDYRIIVLG